jgi:hypothetical protein
MSSTNPEHGRPSADPVGGLAPVSPAAPRADDHDMSGPPPAETIARGHEADKYDAASVLSVPLLVVLFFVLAFGTVTILFYFITPSSTDPNVNPQARDWNKEDLNERIDRLPDPRPEGLKTRSGESRAITQPEKPVGNSPWIHADDVRANPTNTPALYKFGWIDPSKKFARISIDDAMELALQPADKGGLPIAKSQSAPRGSSQVPTAANAGRPAPPPVPPAAPEGKAGGKN